MRLALVFDKTREDTTGIYFERACQELGIPYEHFWTRDAQTISTGYDLYVRIDHGFYEEDLPSRLSPKVFYAIDTHLPKPREQIRRLAQRYDVVCYAQPTAQHLLPQGVWLPLACDPTLHQPVPGPKQWDVAFVGGEGGMPRRFYLQALRERYRHSFIGCAPHLQLGRIYSQANIGFNYSIQDDMNMRIFEILSCGALLVTNHLSHDGFRQLGLHERQHYVSYRSPKELLSLIDYYLCHDQEREAIALQGMREVREHHTYRHRLQQMLRVATERLALRATPLQRDVSSCVSS